MVAILFRKITALIFVFVCVSIVFTATMIVGIYQFRWHTVFARKFSQVVPLPAAYVAGRLIRLSDLDTLVAAYESATSSAQEPADQKKQILSRLVENAIVSDLVRENGIAPTNSEVERYSKYLLRKFAMSSEKFGMSESKFKSMLVSPELARAKLEVYFLKNAETDEAYRKAQEVLQELGEGLSFAPAAQTYSDDLQSKYIGGDIGFLSLANLDPWLADKVSLLGIGETSGVVISPAGYHILQIKGKDDSVGQIHVRQILIRGRELSDFLGQYHYKVYSFLKI